MRNRPIGLLLAAVVAVTLLASCSSDDPETSSGSDATTTTTTAEDAYCADGEQLKTDVAGLGDLDLPGDGTDAVKAQIETIKTDLSTLKESAGDVASTEIAALETSIDTLETSVDAVAGELTLSNGAEVIVAIKDVGADGTAVATTLEAACS